MIGRLSRVITAAALAFLPTWLGRRIANVFGHRIAAGARVGFSLLLADMICMQSGSSVGHFSFVACRRLVMRSGARIGHLNRCTGPVSIALKGDAALGNQNVVTRATRGITVGPAQLHLGQLSKITVSHKVDCTASVIIGDFTTLAGSSSQIWTHGYVHAVNGSSRYRVDGRVRIGNNVYIGSNTVVTGGVRIADQVVVGVGVTVAKDLIEPGFYVSAPLRRLPRPADPDTRDDMHRVDTPELVETVFRKVNGGP